MWLSILKFVCIFFSVIFSGIIIFLLIESSFLADKFGTDAADFFRAESSLVKRKISKKWKENQKRLASHQEANLKLAIIETDSIIDDLFKRMGYKGESLGERLKQIKPAQIPYIEDVWQAHKIRNNVVHNQDYKLTYGEAKKALDIYEKILKDFQVL